MVAGSMAVDKELLYKLAIHGIDRRINEWTLVMNMAVDNKTSRMALNYIKDYQSVKAELLCELYEEE